MAVRYHENMDTRMRSEATLEIWNYFDLRELRFDSGSCVRVKLAARFLFYLRFGDYNFKSFPILGQNVYTGGGYKKRSALKVSPCKKRSVLKVSPIPHARLPGCRHCPKAPTTQGVRPWVDSICSVTRMEDDKATSAQLGKLRRDHYSGLGRHETFLWRIEIQNSLYWRAKFTIWHHQLSDNLNSLVLKNLSLLIRTACQSHCLILSISSLEMNHLKLAPRVPNLSDSSNPDQILQTLYLHRRFFRLN